MHSEQISFPGSAGVMLAARQDRPEGPIRAAAILAHNFTCSTDSVRPEGDCSADARTGLLAIAEKCPLHRTLHGQVLIVIALS